MSCVTRMGNRRVGQKFGIHFSCVSSFVACRLRSLTISSSLPLLHNCDSRARSRRSIDKIIFFNILVNLVFLHSYYILHFQHLMQRRIVSAPKICMYYILIRYRTVVFFSSLFTDFFFSLVYLNTRSPSKIIMKLRDSFFSQLKYEKKKLKLYTIVTVMIFFVCCARRLPVPKQRGVYYYILSKGTNVREHEPKKKTKDFFLLHFNNKYSYFPCSMTRCLCLCYS